MIKKTLIKLIAILLAFALGFLLCLFTVKSARQEWDELETKRLRQIERLSRMVEQMNEEYSEMATYNDEAVVRPEEGK